MLRRYAHMASEIAIYYGEPLTLCLWMLAQ
jgi:hypothetical protein